MALARRLSSCAYNGTRLDVQTYQSVAVVIVALTVGGPVPALPPGPLSGSTRPVEPVPTACLILAALAEMPEAAAVLLLLLQWRRRGPPHGRLHWHWRSRLTLGMVVIAGAIERTGLG